MLSSLYRIIARIQAVFHPDEFDSQLDAELESHIKLLTEDHIRRGASPEEANRLARIEFGGATQLREAHRETRGLPFVDTLLQDLRYTFRVLRRNLSFATFTILIVGLGVGASTVTFSIVNAILVRPLPFAYSRGLVWVGNTATDGVAEWSLQVWHFLGFRDQNKSFSDLTTYSTNFQPGDVKITVDGEAERVSGLRVSQNFFPFFGVNPMLGRTFTADECKWQAPGAVMLSYGLWARRYGSDPNIVGRTLTLNDRQVTIVGVVPASFDFGTVFSPGSQIDVYRPMPLTPETNQQGNTLGVIGRLKPGANIENARAEFDVLAGDLRKQHPEWNTIRPKLTSLEQHVTGRFRRAIIVLAWAVGAVMLIVCANVGNLQLARTAARQKEIAIRVAIGAGQRRLIRQMLTESMVLSFCGAALGVILATAGTRVIAGTNAFSIPLLSNVRMDFTSLAFSLVFAIVTGLLFGLAPALQVSSTSVYEALKDTSRSSGGTKRHHWIRNGLVVSEFVFVCVLLVGTGLLARSFLNVLQVNLGFQPERAAALRIDPSRSFATQAQRNNYYNEVLERMGSVPGISAAGLTDTLPLAGTRGYAIAAQGKVYPLDKYPEGFIHVVSGGYIRTMGIPLRSGRDFAAEDIPTSEPVAMVNETLARTFWPGENPIGKILIADGVRSGQPGRRVVGVVGDVRHGALENEAGLEVYIPMLQTNDYGRVQLVVSTALPPSALAPSIRAALHPIAPELSTNEFTVIQQLVDKAVSPRRFTVVLLAGFSAFALILAALGIYAVISYSVDQRTAELGIRMALGATPRNLQTRIVLQTLEVAGVGIFVGSVAAWIFARALSTLLFGVTFSDPATFGGMLIVLTAVAVLAGYLPARRVSRIDPLAALRAS